MKKSQIIVAWLLNVYSFFRTLSASLLFMNRFIRIVSCRTIKRLLGWKILNTNALISRKSKEMLTPFTWVVFGILIGVSSTLFTLEKMNSLSAGDLSTRPFFKDTHVVTKNFNTTTKIWVPTNPRGAERLVPGIVSAESDFYLRRLWGNPSEDLAIKPKYLLTLAVGYEQKYNVDAIVKKFSENFTIVLFHYDNQTSEWDEFEWAKRAIHVTAHKQTKWWYAKRFLHPDIVAPYDYIFIWDEDLGVQHFDAEKYIKLMRKYQLEISQPGLDPVSNSTWKMTQKRGDQEVHKELDEKPDWCDPHLPPCAAFVEIMAPVFSRDAWRCVWHMIQNDLVHGWGIDFALRRCVEPAHEKIGIVDAQWITHHWVPSLDNQGELHEGKPSGSEVRERCKKEWETFQNRLRREEISYYKKKGIDPPKSAFYHYQ